jgi:FMN reductase
VRATVVVGNPKPASRTRAVGEAVARAVLPDSEVIVIEVSALAGELFSWGSPAVAEAKAAVLSSDLVVVASPVYKAALTGLLKAFLDQFGRDELGARAVVPVMVGAAPDHALAVEHQLRPVLVEIGASCPTRGLYVLEPQVDDFDPLLSAWLAVWGPALRAVIAA